MGDEDPDSESVRNMFKSLMSGFKKVEDNVQDMQTNISQITTDVSQVKLDVKQLQQSVVIEQEKNEATSARVQKLESAGPAPSREMAAVRRSLAQFDPANRSLAFIGMGEENVTKRVESLIKFLSENFPDVRVRGFDHIPKMDTGVRRLGPISIVELDNRFVREHVLEEIKTKNIVYKDCSGASPKIDRAKSESQRARNKALYRALAALKKHCNGKTVKVEWLLPETKDRQVTVDGECAFLQGPQDSLGAFVTPYLGLSLDPV